MTTWFISRHPGAIDWAKQQNLHIDRWATHLDSIDEIQCGDIVMGTLPIHLAADICQKGAKFYFLELNIDEEQRGKELNLKELNEIGASLVRYHIEKQ